MTRSRKFRFLALFVVLAAVSAIAGMSASSADSLQRATGGKAVAHRDGKAVNASNAPIAVTYSIGTHALEPTLGIDKDGDIFYAAAGFDNAVGEPWTLVMHSKDEGKTWKDTSPRVLDQHEMAISLDPYVYVDETTGRVFTIDLTLACSYMSFSDDKGASWVTNPMSCSQPVNDHQTLFAGPPVTSPTVGYPNILYYCWNDVGSSSCAKSLDGGLSFQRTGAPAFTGYDTNGSQDPGFYDVNGFCGGLHGHGAVAPDGTVYIPREYCGKVMVAISHDEGLTWEDVKVTDMRSPSQPVEGAPHPSVTVDSKGNVYMMWIGQQDRMPYMATSTDGGEHWSKPFMVAPPGVNEANLPQIDVRSPGKVALVYYGSTNSPYHSCAPDKCRNDLWKDATWNGYITVSANALSKNPLFYTGTVNDPKDPLIRQQCGPGRCQAAYDFIDVEISPDGEAYGAFVDGCMSDCTAKQPDGDKYEGLFAKLVGGPSLK